MRIKGFSLKKRVGLDHVEVTDLSDVVVVAGPNGVGKTRLITALINFFQNPTASNDFRLSIEATSDIEAKAWGKRTLDTSVQEDIQRLRQTFQRTQRRGQYNSTILNFDSDRSIVQVQPFNFSWDFPDPYEEDVGWNTSLNFLRDRFQDVRHSLFKLVESSAAQDFRASCKPNDARKDEHAARLS